MPCYLFTYHAYGSWMPDRRKGYVRRHQGILASDSKVADQYRRNAKHSTATFVAEHQLTCIETVRSAVVPIDCRLHFIATDPTHVHVLVSWNGVRTWEQNRISLKRALTIALKEKHGERSWLCGGASRKRARDREHFEYLVARYLPSHRGWKWCERRGLYLVSDDIRRSGMSGET